jgi:glutamyl-tRNA(Gln) amidotransferase subunit E
MSLKINPIDNYNNTRKEIGYVEFHKATQDDYDRIGFMSGLEVHQQLLTDEKLFCHCPAGLFNDDDDFDAEVIRHMRPTLSELGEYDGTALMEFKTRKTIVYRLKNETTCTYEVADTPPFPINRQALEEAIEISLLSKLNIVGEVHITRKQYLDGSIPTGFQRTAIIGVEGEIYLKDRPVRLIQLSIEEDSCREVSDVGHTRVYKTDRLGMPLIETVTYPEFKNPHEVKEGCDYIRFLNRSTGKVRTGMGAGRQDVNVSCKGGHRVEIKGVAHTKWIPRLAHNEAFRQWALLALKDKLNKRLPDHKDWKISHREIKPSDLKTLPDIVKQNVDRNAKLIAVNLKGFAGILSHFTQPGGGCFAGEISGRLKVIACLDQPNMTHSESMNPLFDNAVWQNLAELLKAGEEDAQILFWSPEDDITTALETIEERCLMAFDGIPGETRKSFENGTTIFERVLPGADRMYPDTDSAPIPLTTDYIEKLREGLPSEVIDRYRELKDAGVAEDNFTYIFSKNLYPLIIKISNELGYSKKFIGNFIGQTMKFIENHYTSADIFRYEQLYDLFEWLKNNNIDAALAKPVLKELFVHPKMDFESIADTIGFKRKTKEEIKAMIPFLIQKFNETARVNTPENRNNWIMGQLRKTAIGNINLSELNTLINS